MNNRSLGWWRMHVDQQRASGLSSVKYCEEHGLTFNQFRYRQRLLMKKCSDGKINARSSTSSSPLIPISISHDVHQKNQPQLYCTIEYAHGVRLQVQSAAVLAMLPQLLISQS